jgi:hypothetical protein
MAQPDLVSQKIMHTDPQVGFGEASVLPYRQHQLDTRGFEALERSNTRRQLAEQELQKSNEAFYNERLGKLNEYNHMFKGYVDKLTSNVVETAKKAQLRTGGRISTDPEFNNAFATRQAVAQSTMQLQKEADDFEKLTPNYVGKYIDLTELKSETIKNLGKVALKVNDGDSSALQSSVKPDLTDPKFFKIDEFIYDKTKDIKNSTQSTDSIINGSLGQYVQHTDKGYKFSTKDANGNLIPGVDKSVVDYFLTVPTTDPDTLKFRAVIGNLADTQIEHKALQIMQSDPAYRNLREDQVPEELKRLKRQIAFDQNSKYFEGKDAVQAKILKGKLDPFQVSNEKTTISSGHKYPSDGSGSGAETNSPEGILIKTLAGLQQQTPEFVAGLDESEEVNENGVPYLNATPLFSGINTGQDKDGKGSEPDAVFIDPDDQGTIYIRQNPGDPLTPMNNAAVSQFAVQIGNIKGNNLNYKTMMQEGNKLGVFGANNQFKGENAAVADPAFAKKQKAISKKVANEVVNRKTLLKSALDSEKGSWMTDFNRTKVDKVQEDINKNVLSNSTLIAKDQTIKDPKVTIERGLLGGVTYVIKGADNTEVKLTEDEFYSIAEGNSDSGRLIVGREAVKSKPATKAKKSISGF